MIVDMDAAEHAIRAAVERAEQMAGDNIDRVVINISAGKPQCETGCLSRFPSVVSGINEQRSSRRLIGPRAE